MTPVLHIVLEFARAESAGQPHGFRFAAQPYLLRTSGGGFETAEFPWSRALLEDLRALRGGASPEVIHRVGDLLRDFLSDAGWSAHEQAIVAAVRAGSAIYITVRSAAAELYALPWELLALKSTGQLLGGIPGLVVRYEWPETASFPDPIPAPARRGRVLFAWSAAGGGVPAAEHLAGLQAALRAPDVDFDPTRDVLAHASFAAISAALAAARRDGPPIDALHLLCHGAAAGGTYGLALDDEGEPGGRVVVDAGRLQQLLAPHAGMLRLVVLAACDSGNVGELGNHVGSVAQMIHRAGLRAVVASRFPLSAAGSASFTAALFAALGVQGTTLEYAFLAAREALVRDPEQLDWASVQLYARAADGDASYPLGRVTPPVVTPPPATLPPPPGPARRVRWLALVPVAAIALVLAVRPYWRPGTDVADPVPAPQPTGPALSAPPNEPPAPRPEVPPITTPPPLTASEPTAPVAAITTPTVTPGKSRTPKPAPPRAPGERCPNDLRIFLNNNLPQPSGGGVRPELRVDVAADGGLAYEVLGDPRSYEQEAHARLPRLSDRLIDTHAAELPCRIKLIRP